MSISIRRCSPEVRRYGPLEVSSRPFPCEPNYTYVLRTGRGPNGRMCFMRHLHRRGRPQPQPTHVTIVVEGNGNGGSEPVIIREGDGGDCVGGPVVIQGGDDNRHRGAVNIRHADMRRWYFQPRSTVWQGRHGRVGGNQETSMRYQPRWWQRDNRQNYHEEDGGIWERGRPRVHWMDGRSDGSLSPCPGLTRSVSSVSSSSTGSEGRGGGGRCPRTPMSSPERGTRVLERCPRGEQGGCCAEGCDGRAVGYGGMPREGGGRWREVPCFDEELGPGVVREPRS